MDYDVNKRIPTCRGCGAELTFVRMPNGKFMPCEHRPRWVLPNENGVLHYDMNGEPIRAREADKRLQGTTIAYLPHWSNCGALEKVRRKPDELTERIRAQVAKEKADAQRRAERRQRKEAEERERKTAMEAQMSLFPGNV